MLVPKEVRRGVAFVDSAPFDMQERLQQGCNCCGWSGDPFLSIRVAPRGYGDGYWVIHDQPGEDCLILWKTEGPLHQLDHRVIDYFRDSRENWEQGALIADMMDKHDAKVDADIAKQGAELNAEVSKMAMGFMKKHDMIPAKHKIDTKKD